MYSRRFFKPDTSQRGDACIAGGGSGGPGVCRDGAILSHLAGWNENTPHMKMHWSRPHLNRPNNSVETTQSWDGHNKPEHWSQHEVSISQASIHSEANQGFVVNTGGWLMSGPEELGTWFFCLACWLCLTVLVPAFLYSVSLTNKHLMCRALQCSESVFSVNRKSKPDLKYLIFLSFHVNTKNPIEVMDPQQAT